VLERYEEALPANKGRTMNKMAAKFLVSVKVHGLLYSNTLPLTNIKMAFDPGKQNGGLRISSPPN
jgi:hypothetical protein